MIFFDGRIGLRRQNYINLVYVVILLSIVVILVAFYLLYRTQISLWLAKRKLKNLLLRKDTLKKLMGSTQKDYFQYGKISESTYRMRIKNFGDLVRDIDRQIPLLQKDIARYSFSKKDYERVIKGEKEKVTKKEREKARLGRRS